jgi:hypothetical protein
MMTQCASYEGAVQCNAHVDSKTGKDHVTVSFIPWHGHGSDYTIYSGRIDGESVDIDMIRTAINSYLKNKGVPRSNIETAMKKVEDILKHHELLEAV